MWLPMPGSTFPSLGTSFLLPSELGCNSRLVAAPCPVSRSLTKAALVAKFETTRKRVRSSPSEGLTRIGGELR